MSDEITKYEFSAKPYYYSASKDMTGWTIVSLPKETSVKIRDKFKRREEGWGRMKVKVKIGSTKWQTAIWFDTKQDTYLLPLKSEVRKKENIALDQNVKIIIFI